RRGNACRRASADVFSCIQIRYSKFQEEITRCRPCVNFFSTNQAALGSQVDLAPKTGSI
ncbi:unnamed protein product, partial [Ascophyllum nodosum]